MIMTAINKSNDSSSYEYSTIYCNKDKFKDPLKIETSTRKGNLHEANIFNRPNANQHMALL